MNPGVRPLRRRSLVLMLACCAPLAALGTEAPRTFEDGTSWVLTSDAARSVVESGALVLDVREKSLFRRSDLPNAVAVQWTDLSEPRLPHKGKLLADDARLQARLRDLGLTLSRPVVVVGEPLRGWGEDGRIAWTLRTLGHPGAFIVDGGAAALLQRGSLRVVPATVPGDFVVSRTSRWDIGKDELKARLGKPGVVVLDSREPREFAGDTPYGESRGGHLPGARHLHFKELMDQTGRLLPRPQIEQRLARAGVGRDSEVVSYCSGGIRSAWLTAVLADMGYRARNYAGSMWEWSAGPAVEYPLSKTD